MLDLLSVYGRHFPDCAAAAGGSACDCGWENAERELEQIETHIPG
jgi:hypothetical protein